HRRKSSRRFSRDATHFAAGQGTALACCALPSDWGGARGSGFGPLFFAVDGFVCGVGGFVIAVGALALLELAHHLDPFGELAQVRARRVAALAPGTGLVRVRVVGAAVAIQLQAAGVALDLELRARDQLRGCVDPLDVGVAAVVVADARETAALARAVLLEVLRTVYFFATGFQGRIGLRQAAARDALTLAVRLSSFRDIRHESARGRGPVRDGSVRGRFLG